jgi:hypothetical protein
MGTTHCGAAGFDILWRAGWWRQRAEHRQADAAAAAVPWQQAREEGATDVGGGAGGGGCNALASLASLAVRAAFRGLVVGLGAQLRRLAAGAVSQHCGAVRAAGLRVCARYGLNFVRTAHAALLA